MTADRETSEIERIWSAQATYGRWHAIWQQTLHAQADLNPRHPGNERRPTPSGTARTNATDLDRYEWTIGKIHRHPDQHAQLVAERQTQTRHDLVAALQVLNDESSASTAHLGLTSSDITDPANQVAILTSLEYVSDLGWHVATRLADQAERWATRRIVARTHGQPAQATTLGHRYATILGPLISWLHRVSETFEMYPIRPQHGAVGTGADLHRVLEGWQPLSVVYGEGSTTGFEATPSASEASAGTETPAEDADSGSTPQVAWYLTAGNRQRTNREYQRRLRGSAIGMPATRQVYHRSHDLPVAGHLVELATIAQTWATDRRLESMLGLGAERFADGQVGSSAMAHKSNPRICERLCALSVVARGHYSVMAELAGMEWLEGDVSTSAARRLTLPAMFRNAETILHNWAWAIDHWEPDTDALDAELHRYRHQINSGLYLQILVESGMGRDLAHAALLDLYRRLDKHHPNVGWFLHELGKLARYGRGGLDILHRVEREQDQPIGIVQGEIEELVRSVRRGKPGDLVEFEPKVAW